jgi:hypothetical protein
MYPFVRSKYCNRFGVNKVEALVYIYTNSKLLRRRPGANPIHWYKDIIFSEDSNLDDNGQEIRNEGKDDDGDFLTSGAQMREANEPQVQRVLNNYVDGPNVDVFDWDRFSDEDSVGGADGGSWESFFND